MIGGGVIGLELGMMYQRLGTRLTIIEMTDELLPGVDRDLVRVVERRLRARGATVLTGAKALGWAERDGRAVVRLERGGATETVVAECILVAVGFLPNSGGLGLERLGVRLDERAHIRVDDRLESSVPGIYAIGDVAGAPYLAQSLEGGGAGRGGDRGKRVRRDWYALPAAIFTDPEVAVVG